MSKKVVEKLLKSDFKNEVVSNVSSEISVSAQDLLNDIILDKKRSDILLKEIEENHESLLDASANEFSRTIEVLRKVRLGYSEPKATTQGNNNGQTQE